MFVGNHPNGLIDPALVFVLTHRHVTFLAKEPLFRIPVIGWLLRGLQCLPVYRKQDDPSQMGKNEGTLDAARGALVAGRAITLFPEGKSHSEPSLAELKTGAARIALSAAKQGAAVRIVPVGLTYADKHRFRSEVLIEMGAPIEVRDFLPAHGLGRDRVGARPHRAHRRRPALRHPQPVAVGGPAAHRAGRAALCPPPEAHARPRAAAHLGPRTPALPHRAARALRADARGHDVLPATACSWCARTLGPVAGVPARARGALHRQERGVAALRPAAVRPGARALLRALPVSSMGEPQGRAGHPGHGEVPRARW